ncbi:MAG: hypothetical protein WCO44_13355, partial [Bacteroidota bacterium]
ADRFQDATSSIQTQLNGKSPIAGSTSLTIGGKMGVINIKADSSIYAGLKSNGNSSTAINIYASQGNTQTVTRTGSATYTIIGMVAGQSLTLVMVHEASTTAYTVTFSPAVIWPGGVVPAFTNTSGAVDVVCIRYDGSRYLAMQSADFK